MKSKLTLKEKLLVYCVFVPIVVIPMGTLVMKWYNHVWFITQLGWWKLIVLACLIIAVSLLYKPIKYVTQLGFAVTLILQVLGWINLIALPIINK